MKYVSTFEWFLSLPTSRQQRLLRLSKAVSREGVTPEQFLSTVHYEERRRREELAA